MSAVSLCPRCHKPVSLPVGVNLAALVRCPLCDAEYELRDAIPPKLIPIAVVTPQQPARTSAPDLHFTHSDSYQVAEEENEAVVAARTLMAASRVPKPPVPRSPIKTLVEIILGGLAGCLVAYYALAFYYGPQFKTKGLPELPLPFIAGLINPADNAEVASPSDVAEEQPTRRAADTSESAVPAAPAKVVPEAVTPPAPESADSTDDLSLLRPRPGSAGYVGPRLCPPVDSDELAAALRKANSISIANADDPMPPSIYESFCELGTRVTFVNGPAADTELSERIAAARTLLEKVGTSPERMDKVGLLADRRLDENKTQNAGILLAGKVQDVARQGRLWTATLRVAGISTTVGIASREALNVKADDRVLVLGVVVQEPEANLVGYTGTRSMVVWSGACAKIP